MIRVVIILLLLASLIGFLVVSCSDDGVVDEEASNSGSTDAGGNDGETSDGGSSEGDGNTDVKDEAHTHSFGEWTVTAEPSCSENGKKVRECSCGAQEVEVLSRTDHSYGEWIVNGIPSCITSASKSRSCACSDTQIIVLNATGHTMSENQCTVCGATYSEGLTFTSNGDGTCYVEDIGTCTDEDLFIPPTSPENDIVIHIEDYAFASSEKIKSVVVGSNLKTIGSHAFASCKSLVNVVITSSVTVIDEDAFWNCTKLSELSFCNNSALETIGARAFEQCESLSLVNIPDSVTGIGYSAFGYCTSLSDVIIGNGVKNIDDYAFSGCAMLTNLSLGSSLETIGEGAFSSCEKLDKVTFPSSLTTIGDEAFWHCDSLVRFYFDDNSKLESIGERAFEYCESLDSIAIPNSTLEIGYAAFSYCKNLNDVVIGNGVKIIDGYAFADCISMTSLVIGNGVETIGESAFSRCEKLENVVFPDSLKYINEEAFLRCSALAEFVFTDNSNLQTIGMRAFEHCDNLICAILPDSLTEIGYSAFGYCAKLEEVVIADGVELIEGDAFINCTELSSLVLGSKVQVIGESAFSGCTKIASIVFPDTLVTISASAFQNCVALESISFGADSQLQTIGARAFQRCESLTVINIPDSVTEIDQSAFGYCENLEYAIIGRGVQKIGSAIFGSSHLLKRIYYNGSKEEWNAIDIDASNGYPLDATPYCYSNVSPVDIGDYWYFDTQGTPKVWQITSDVFKAQYYSDHYASEFLGSPSYATVFYNDLEYDIVLKLTIVLWKNEHVSVDPSLAFDPDNAVISQKDLYVLTLHDLLVGNSKGEESDVFFGAFFDSFENAELETLISVIQALNNFDNAQMSADDFKALIENKSLDELNAYLNTACESLTADAVKKALEKTYSSEGVAYFDSVLSSEKSLGDAVLISARYEAVKRVKNEYLNVLSLIKDDVNVASDMRTAAEELYESYQAAFDNVLAQFGTMALVDVSSQGIVESLVSDTVDSLINKVGMLRAISFEGKGIDSICELLDMTELEKSYYMLETAVMLESAITRISNESFKDYFKVDNKSSAAVYVSMIKIYERSVILGMEKAKEFVEVRVGFEGTTEEVVEQCTELIDTLTQKIDMSYELFDEFEDLSIEAYNTYCS